MSNPKKGWSIMTTGMSKKFAKRAAKVIEAACPGVYAEARNPRYSYVISADRCTTEMLRDALRLLDQSGGYVGAVLEDIEEWLENDAAPHPEGEGCDLHSSGEN